MYAVEFRTKIKNGIIYIPKEYRDKLQENVKVIVLKDEEEGKNANMIDQLLEAPLKMNNFRPLSREEIYGRN
ncbi:MAG: hypothetical protein HZA01_12635 [Nitrospinae bacterium]|nr:hypothetical protein [Nitrospinota bacterium]